MVKISLGSGVSTVEGNNFGFDIKFDKNELNKKTERLAEEANFLTRQHIKDSLKGAATQTAKNIRGRSVKSNKRSTIKVLKKGVGGAPVKIADSLGYNFRSASKKHVAYVAGSYDTDEGLNFMTKFSPIRGTPTGVRASKMKKRDPSLTQIYDRTTGAFEVTGIISNPEQTGGLVRDGETAAWKRKQETANRPVFYAMKGYGAGLKRKGKPAPKVMRGGFRGLNTLPMYERIYRARIADTQELQRKLEAITERSMSRQTTLGEF